MERARFWMTFGDAYINHLTVLQNVGMTRIDPVLYNGQEIVPLQFLKAVLPEQKDVADLLRRIQTLATQSNLAIRGFKPAPSVTKQLHAEWPIALQLDGTYHNLAMFFDRVSKFSRIINVSGIAIRAKEKPEPNSTITVDCIATTFVLLETAKPAAPGAKAN